MDKDKYNILNFKLYYIIQGIVIENKKLNLKNDVVFKAFFSRKGNEKYLIDFLNALLQIEIEEIKIQEEVNLEKLNTMEKGICIKYNNCTR